MTCPLENKSIEPLLTAAAERGAKLALERIGLHDDDAGKDVRDLRDLIDGWRSAKKAVGETIVKWITVGVLGAIATSLYLKTWGVK